MLAIDQQKALGELVVRAWRDPMFKERLLSSPKEVLGAAGIEIDQNVQVEVLENTREKVYLTLPARPYLLPESDEDVWAAAWPSGKPGAPNTPRDQGCCGGKSK